MKGELAALDRPARTRNLARALRAAVRRAAGRGSSGRGSPSRAASGTAAVELPTGARTTTERTATESTTTERTVLAPAKFPPEVAPLWRRYARRPDDENRNRLVEAYQPLVREVVSRFAARLPRTVDRGDLSNAGNMGLIAAVSSFDRARGVRFEAYAELRIRGALLDELRQQDWLPRPWRQRLEQHKRVVERLRAEATGEPHDDDIAEAMGLDVGEYQALFGTGLPGVRSGSVNGDEERDRSAEMEGVADTRSGTPDVRLSNEELVALVAERLTEQEFRLLYLRYWQDLPLREIGEHLQLSESRVSKIHSRLIERLADRLRPHVAF